VKACTLFAVQADGRAIQTVEALSEPGDELHPMQAAFWAEHGLQCGYCTAGIIMASINLVRDAERVPEDDEIREAISGNICRCTGYSDIVAAVRRAARERLEASAQQEGRSPDTDA
jgi:carbon-monoxide dehydrogenase small subunit